MALQKQIDKQSGISMPSAYIKITGINLDYSLNQAVITVGIYKDSFAYLAGNPEEITYNHICGGTSFTTYFSENVLLPATVSPLTKSYEWLLTLPSYSGALIV